MGKTHKGVPKGAIPVRIAITKVEAALNMRKNFWSFASDTSNYNLKANIPLFISKVESKNFFDTYVLPVTFQIS